MWLLFGDFDFLWCFLDGKSWWSCGEMSAKRGQLTVAFRGLKLRHSFQLFFPFVFIRRAPGFGGL
jgi:hypothetical protein